MTTRGGGEGTDRIATASDWFARMRAPDADAARAEFETWHADPDNALAYDEIAAVWDIAGTSSTRRLANPASARRARRALPGLIAAGLGAAIVVGFVLYRNGGEHPPAPLLAYASAADVLREVTLADGSRVTLDRASRIDVSIGRDERRVTLIAGRARFSVAHDAAHPFVVLAGESAVVARGTVFDVRLGQGLVDVVLLEGAVDLEQRAANRPVRRLGHLRPGQVARFVPSEVLPRISAASADPWPGAIVSGEGMRLAEVVAEANRNGRLRIVLGEPGLADLRVSGGYRPTDTEALAASLAAALDLVVEPGANGVLTLHRASGRPTSAPCGSRPCRSS